MERRNWSRDELIVALNLYLKLPFGKMHSRTKEIIELSNIIGRTPSSVSMRLGNFASVDPYHQQRGIKGLTGGLKQVEPIWNEFVNNKEELLFESENILANLQHKTIETKFEDLLKGTENLKGETKLREVKTRVNQNIFRQITLANYSCKCAITGIDIPEFLVASHILPWSKHEEERLNPQNGLCLNTLHDKAFDKGFITITTDFKVKVSKVLHDYKKNNSILELLLKYENQPIIQPKKFLPSIEFLDYHHKSIFQK